ncbi:MAG TPA: diguanylate cyclase [Noviherbaspirillum sp.]|nr:diguanylate cyclase [Noviherbaspirillum sp.]
MTKPVSAPVKPFRPLSRRVVTWALFYSTLITLAMTAILIAIDYQDERKDAIDQMRFAAASYRKSLANSLWDLDMAAVRLQMEGLASFPMVGHAVLTTTIGKSVHTHKRSAVMFRDHAGEHDPADPLSWRETLVSPYNPDLVVGHLHLYVDRPAFLHRIETSAARILAGEAFKGLVLGLLIAWLIGRLVTRHLSHMAKQMASLHPTAMGQALTLSRIERRHVDELDQLCDAFNQLNHQLVEYIDNKRALEDELRQHRDRLSEMVGERTRSLERLRGFHGLIIRVLTRFINLPPGHANEAVDHGLSAFGDYFGARRCLLYTYDMEARGFGVANAWPLLNGESDAHQMFLTDDVLPRRMLADRRSRVWLCGENAANPQDPLLALFGCDAYTAVGVEVKGNTVGLLCLVGRAIPQESETATLVELAARVSANMLDHKAAQITLLDTQQALQKANRELHSLSRHDPLTGLANRRHFDDLKDVEFRRAMRASTPLSVMMCDIDEFKRYNDTYGHAQGDRCLQNIAEKLAPLFNRAGELLARLGGEEFVVLLPNTTAAQAQILAERMREAVWDANIPHASSNVADRVTVSVGVASLKHGLHQDFDSLLQDADLALYRAKNGRNRTVLAE